MTLDRHYGLPFPTASALIDTRGPRYAVVINAERDCFHVVYCEDAEDANREYAVWCGEFESDRTTIYLPTCTPLDNRTAGDRPQQ